MRKPILLVSSAFLILALVVVIPVVPAGKAASAESLLRDVEFSQMGTLQAQILITDREEMKSVLTSDADIELEAYTDNWGAYFDGGLTYEQVADGDRVLVSSAGDVEFGVKQAYVDLWYDFADVRIGKQLVPWGTGYSFNPVDVINPSSGDLLDFEKMGVNAVRGTYYAGNGFIEGVLVTNFETAGPKTGAQAEGFARDAGLPFPNVSVSMPGGTEEFEYALRSGITLGGWDAAAVYYYGREDSPYTAVDPLMGSVEFYYPSKKMVGAEFAGSLGNVGIWGEGARSLVDAREGEVTYDQYLFGADYVFESGLHVLGEYYVDGSLSVLNPVYEGKEAFGLIVADYPLTSLSQLMGTLGFNVEDKSYALSVELTRSLGQNADFVAGAAMFEGKDGSFFDADSNPLIPFGKGFYARVEYYF